MTEKVKLPKAVAEAIETLRNAEYSDYGVVKYVDVGGPIHVKHGAEIQNTLRGWTYENGGRNSDLLLDALRIGYEVEEEYKVGDWKKVQLANGNWVIGKIDTIAFEDIIMNYLDEDGIWQRVRELAERSFNPTPEEIKAEKERRVWARIGREVNEWKEGDAYDHRNYLVKFYVDGSDLSKKKAKEAYDNGKVKGFYPAEYFISFGGEEA